MSLSNCQECKFNGQKGCAVNPDYWEVHHVVNGSLVTSARSHFKSLIPDCKDWLAAPDLEPLTLSITLTQREWMAVAQGRQISGQIIPQVRNALNYIPPEQHDDIPF